MWWQLGSSFRTEYVTEGGVTGENVDRLFFPEDFLWKSYAPGDVWEYDLENEVVVENILESNFRPTSGLLQISRKGWDYAEPTTGALK